MARKTVDVESVEVPLEIAAPEVEDAVLAVPELPLSAPLSSADVVEVWKTLTALVHDPQAGCSHKARVETATYAFPILVDALKQLGYSVHNGVLIPPGCHWDEKTGQLVYPEA